jgi:hypothetical protein
VETLVSRQRSTSDASSRLGSELIRRFLLEHAYVQALLKEVLIDSRSAWVSLLSIVSTMHFRANPENDAYATIRGFVFRGNLTVLQRLNLSKNEHLELECGEDIDVVGKALGDVIHQNLAADEPPVELAGVRELGQIKVRAGNLTMKSGSPSDRSLL